jgi:hypothetical protein
MSSTWFRKKGRNEFSEINNERSEILCHQGTQRYKETQKIFSEKLYLSE